jgi:hypothetical protein
VEIKRDLPKGVNWEMTKKRLHKLSIEQVKEREALQMLKERRRRRSLACTKWEKTLIVA